MMSRKLLSALAALCLLAVIGYSGARLWRMDTEAAAERELHAQLLQHKPVPQEEGQPPAPVHPLERLQKKNKDIIGWITVPYTNIDYPFVQAKDNDTYLRRDLKGEYALAGTLFLDYRCPKNGAGYSILYGHNMKNGSMFGTLRRFEDKAFFDAHPEGSLLLEDGWHSLRFFAFLIVSSTDRVVYGQPQDDAQTRALLEEVRRRAKHYRENDAAPGDRLVALSTCAYNFNGARMVLIGKIINTTEGEPVRK